MPYNMATAIWAAELTVWDRYAGAETTLYVASHAGFTVSGSPAVDTFEMVLEQPALASRSMFDDHRTSGRGRAAVGSVVLKNNQGSLDTWRTRYHWDGRSIVLKLGSIGGEYTTGFVTMLDATIERMTVGQTVITIALRDWMRALELPMQTTMYAGDNVAPDGLEGGADLTGKPKPICYGEARDINPVLVNSQKAIFQVNDGVVDSVIVRNRGVGLFPSINFSSRTSFTSTWLRAVSVGNGLVVAGGKVDVSGTPNACFGKSANGGLTWTDLRASLAFGADEVTNILWAFGNKWIITGSGGKIKTTPDLVTYTSRTSGFAISIDCICEGNGVVVIMGAGDNVSYTLDGVTWTHISTGVAGSPNWIAVRRFNGRFIALADDGRIASSAEDDGTTWEVVSTTAFPGVGALRPSNIWPFDTRMVTNTYRNANQPVGQGISDTGLLWSLLPSTIDVLGGPNAIASGGGVCMQVGYRSGAYAGVTTDGSSWTDILIAGFGTDWPIAVCYDDVTNAFVVVGVNGKISSSVENVYANTTDLEDDTLEPPPGFYKVCPSAGYFRVGFLNDGAVIRADVVQGSTSADRTAAQIGKQIMRDRADFASSANLVTNPSALASGWTTSGTLTATNAVTTRKGYSFSRLANTNGGACARIVALTGNTKKVGSWLIISNGSAGFSHVGLFDNIASAWKLLLKYTIDASGVLTATALTGSLLSVRNLGAGIFLVTGRSTTVNAANQHAVYANNTNGGASTLTSVQMADVSIRDAEVEDDWLAFDVVAFDDAQSAVQNFYTDAGDQVTCADALQKLIGGCGGSVSTDRSGVIRLPRLEDPRSNVVVNASALASSPWSGTGTYTDNYAVYDGVSFSRMQGDGSSNYRIQDVTLAADGYKVFSFRVKHNGATGHDVCLLYDTSAPAPLAGARLVFNADGTITITLEIGQSLTQARLPDGSYHVRVLSLYATAAHANRVYASDASGWFGSGGVTDWLAADFRVDEYLPVATIDQADMRGMTEVDSQDPGAPAPPFQTRLKYSKNYAPMSGADFDGVVDDVDRAALMQEWFDVATDPDTDIQDAHPFSETRIEETCFVEQSDAQDEADRRQALHGVDRRMFDVPVFMTDTTLGLEINDVVALASTRYGMGVGTRATVLTSAPDVAAGMITLTCWL
jgi:hypothetical protein